MRSHFTAQLPTHTLHVCYRSPDGEEFLSHKFINGLFVAVDETYVQIVVGASDTVFNVNGREFMKVEATKITVRNKLSEFHRVDGEAVLFRVKTHPTADLIGVYAVDEREFHVPAVTIDPAPVLGTLQFGFYAGATLVGTLGPSGLTAIDVEAALYALYESGGVAELLFSDGSGWKATP